MDRDKIIDRASSENFVTPANTDHFLFPFEDPPISMRDAVASQLTAELDKLIGVQEKLEFFETRIAKDRTRLIYLRAQFYGAGLDNSGQVQAGENLLRTMNRIQQTLEDSCGRLRRPA